MTELSVDRGVIGVWRWSAALTCAIAAAFIVLLALQSAPRAVLVAALALLGLAVIAGIGWYPAARYRRLRYAVDDKGIAIRDGVFWRTQSVLARVRIQHTDVTQGPLQRRYGVATLKLYTAGSHFAKIELPGLAHETAVALRDELQREGDGDAV